MIDHLTPNPRMTRTGAIMSANDRITTHYTSVDALLRIDTELRRRGVDPEHPTLDDLAPFDNFHSRGLGATIDIDDAETPDAQTDGPSHKVPVIVRSAVHDAPAHALHSCNIHPTHWIPLEAADDAAHQRPPDLVRTRRTTRRLWNISSRRSVRRMSRPVQ